jgi:uracil-DNA glycosylase
MLVAMTDDVEHRTLAAVLQWYQAMGVDTAVAASPMAWLDARVPGTGFDLEALRGPADAPPTPPTPRALPPIPPLSQQPVTPASRPQPPPMAPAGERKFTATPPDAAELSAREAARSAKTLDDLRAALDRFDGCGLKATAKNLCMFRGAPRARLMIIGEAPGRDEDLEGKPFVGRAGQLLDKMLAAIGLSEADVHITNVVYWRPPGNRTPTPQEAQVCRPFLERQIELVAPERVLLLGGVAAKHILDTQDGIMKLRGRWSSVPLGNTTLRTLASLHPAYLLRTPAAKRLVWRDLLALRAELSSGK